MAEKKAEHTPIPWQVRINPADEGMFYVSAPTPENHPYFGRTKDVEIMSDEDYPTKYADARYIVKSANYHERLKESLEQVLLFLCTLRNLYPNARQEFIANAESVKQAESLLAEIGEEK